MAPRDRGWPGRMEPRGTPRGHRHAPPPCRAADGAGPWRWEPRGTAALPARGWQLPGKAGLAGHIIGRAPGSCPWAPAARVHRPESCPTQPTRAPGWPDSAPQLRALSVCVCVCARRGDRQHLTPERGLRQRDAQEGGEQCPAQPAARPPAHLGTRCWRRGAEIRASSAPRFCVPQHRLSFENLPSAIRSQGPA